MVIWSEMGAQDKKEWLTHAYQKFYFPWVYNNTYLFITVLTDQTTIPLMFPLVLQPLHGTKSLKININLHH